MGNSYLKVNQEPTKFQTELKLLPESSGKGIYKLYYFRNGQPRTIKRFFSEDPSGLIYIGMTVGPLSHRVANLQRALVSNWRTEEGKPASSGHAQMGQKYYRIRKKINIDDLYIQIFSDENPKQAETDCLENYVYKFGELPPFNGQYGTIEPVWSLFNE